MIQLCLGLCRPMRHIGFLCFLRFFMGTVEPKDTQSVSIVVFRTWVSQHGWILPMLFHLKNSVSTLVISYRHLLACVFCIHNTLDVALFSTTTMLYSCVFLERGNAEQKHAQSKRICPCSHSHVFLHEEQIKQKHNHFKWNTLVFHDCIP